MLISSQAYAASGSAVPSALPSLWTGVPVLLALPLLGGPLGGPPAFGGGGTPLVFFGA